MMMTKDEADQIHALLMQLVREVGMNAVAAVDVARATLVRHTLPELKEIEPRPPQRGAYGEFRSSTKSVAKAVEKGGWITTPTLSHLLTLLEEKTDYPYHIEVAITTGALVKTLDNERDALETVRLLRTKPAKP